jgi:hypothetical protein
MRSRSRRAAATTLALLLGVVACSTADITGTGITLHTARARWATHKPVFYTVTMYRSCECLPEWSGPVIVAVRNDSVISRRYVYSGDDVDPRYAAIFPAVEGLFEIIDAAIRAGTRPLHVRYDSELGYPTRIDIGDRSVDAGELYTVSVFPLR